ncbi:rhomboid family intramembrane serine protease [Allostreptomyces psammosilenae]|nr:rhomboid family intramembrane serine protease [Allostreptomyces psammosilenae]
MGCWVALLWVLELVDTLSGHRLDTFGVIPRVPGEFRDLIPSAFGHFGFAHVAANSLPLFVLGFLAALRGIPRFLAAVAVIMLVSGLGVWLISPPATNTAGASGVVFGLFAYLVVRGFADRRPVDVGVGLLVAAAYGSILWGALPIAEGVSWQGHLSGLIGGVLAAMLLRRSPAPDGF